MIRTRLAGIIPMGDGFAFMHRTDVKNRTYSDYYTFAGGGREEGETNEEGTKREIKEELGIDVEVLELLYNIEKDQSEEFFYLCKYVGGEFGTGEGPEFSGDPKYVDSGKFIPEIIKREDVKNLFLLPPEVKEMLVKDIESGRI